MQSKNIPQSAPPKQFAGGQVTQGQLESLLLAGLKSPARELTDDDWGEIRQEAIAALEALHNK